MRNRYDSNGTLDPLWQPFVYKVKKAICSQCGYVFHDIEVRGIVEPNDELVFLSHCYMCFREKLKEENNGNT